MATTINVILADSTTAITVSTGARGPAGTSATNSVTSATTSDGTAALYIDSLRFETTNGGPTQLGEMAWESTDGSIDAMLESGVIVAMGEDLVIRVRNATASPIAKGAPLAYDGTVGASGRIDVKPWVGSNIASAKFFLGFAAAAMDANGDGYSQWFGKLSGIDTDGGAENWQDEQIIYAVPSASSTLTNVAPTSGEYAVAAVVINAGSGTSGILYVRPSFEKFPVSADITDATNDGQSNPGKVLKTNALGELIIGNLTCDGLGILSNTGSATLSIANLTDDYTYDFPDVGGTFLVDTNASATFSSGKVILWGTSADATLTNLGGGTAGKAIFGAATYTGAGSVRKLAGLDVDDDVGFNRIVTNFATSNQPAITLQSNTALAWPGGASQAIRGFSGRIVFGAGLGATTEWGRWSGSNLRVSGVLMLGGSNDTGAVSLRDEGDNILAQRSGQNSQTFRLYDTQSSDTDYHRIAVSTARATLTNVSGASVTATALIPAGAVVLGVTSKITTALGTGNGTTGYQIGTAADADRWADKTATAEGTTTDNRDWTAGTIECFPAATDVIVTAKGGNFDATGVIYLSVQYMTGQAD